MARTPAGVGWRELALRPAEVGQRTLALGGAPAGRDTHPTITARLPTAGRF